MSEKHFQTVAEHPNVKIFLSHCGYNGLMESMYSGTPMIGLPLLGDHFIAANIITHQGMGLTHEWYDLTEELLMQSIKEVIENKR